MKHFSGMFKRTLAMLLAVVMLLSSSNIGMVAQVFAHEADYEHEHVTLGQLIVKNYDQLNAQEEAIISSGAINGDEDYHYTLPTADDELISVDKDAKTVTAATFTDEAGNIWVPVSFDLTDGNGNIVDGNDDVALDSNYTGTYATESYTFVVEVKYELWIEAPDAQDDLLAAGKKLAADIAILEHLDAVSIFDADEGNEYAAYEAALEKQLSGMTVTAKLALQYLTMDILTDENGESKSVVDMMYLWSTDDQTITVGKDEYVLEITGKANVSAAGNLHKQQEENGNLDLYVFMNTYKDLSYLEWLMEHETELAEALVSNYNDIYQLATHSRGLKNVSAELEALLEEVWETVSEAAEEHSYTVENMDQLNAALETATTARAAKLAELNAALKGTDYERTIEDADDIQALIEDIEDDLDAKVAAANATLKDAGRTETITDAESIAALIEKLEGEIETALAPLNEALAEADYGSTVTKSSQIDDAVAFLRGKISEQLDEQVNANLPDGYEEVKDLEDLANLITTVENEIENGLAALEAALAGTAYEETSIESVADVGTLLNRINADIDEAVAEVNEMLEEAGRTERVTDKASVDALIVTLETEIQNGLDQINTQLNLTGDDALTEAADILPYIQQTESAIATALSPVNQALVTVGYTTDTALITGSDDADIDPAIAHYTNQKQTLISNINTAVSAYGLSYDGTDTSYNNLYTMLGYVGQTSAQETLAQTHQAVQACDQMITMLNAVKTNEDLKTAEATRDTLIAAYNTLYAAEQSVAALEALSAAMAKRDELTAAYNELVTADELLTQLKNGYNELAAVEAQLQQIEAAKSTLATAESHIATLQNAYDNMVLAEELLVNLETAKTALEEGDALIATMTEAKASLEEAEELLDQLNMLIAMMQLTAATLEPVVEAFDDDSDDDSFNAPSVLNVGLTSAQYTALTQNATDLVATEVTTADKLFVTDTVVAHRMSMSDVTINIIVNTLNDENEYEQLTYTKVITMVNGATQYDILLAMQEATIEAAEQEGWEEVKAGKYVGTQLDVPKDFSLSEDTTFDLVAGPIDVSVTLPDATEATAYPFGWNLTLEKHEDSSKEYVYTIYNSDDAVIEANVDQGTKWRITEDIVITRVEGAASEKHSINSLLVNTNTIADSASEAILISGALKKDSSISIALPNSNHVKSQMVDTKAQIVATEVPSRVGNLKWTVKDGTAYDEFGKIVAALNFTGVVAETDKAFDMAEVRFVLNLTAADLGVSAEELVAVMNIPYELSADYTAQKGAMDSLYGQLALFQMLNDYDTVAQGMTVKGMLGMLASMTQYGEETCAAAQTLADLIPSKSEDENANKYVGIVKTLEEYNSYGMRYYYINEVAVIEQIKQLYAPLNTVLSNNDLTTFIGNASAAKLQELQDMHDLLEAALNTLEVAHPIDHDLIDVESEALPNLLGNLGQVNAKQYTTADVPASMNWEHMVKTGAPGKSTVKVSATYKGSPALEKTWTVLTGAALDESEVNAAVAELAELLGVEFDHYTQTEVVLPDTVEEDLTINVTWTAKQYNVFADGVVLGQVTIEGGKITLPAHTQPYYAYTYTINETSYEVKEDYEYSFTRADVEAHLSDGVVTITRAEKDNTPVYNINIIVEAEVMSATNELTDLAPYNYPTFTMKLGTALSEMADEIEAAKQNALAYTGWSGVVDNEHFNVTADALTGNVEGDVTYTVSYSPKSYKVTLEGAEYGEYAYGYNLVLPAHTDEAMEYIYTVNGTDTYDQGQKVKVSGDLTITRVAQEASAKEYLTSLLIKAGIVTDEAMIKILESSALNKGKSIRLTLPDGTAISATAVNGVVTIYVEEVASKVGDANWVALKGYLDTKAEQFTFVNDEYIVPDEDKVEFNKAYAIFTLDLTTEALGVSDQDLLDALNIPYELKTRYDDQKAILDELAGNQSTFAMMNDDPNQKYDVMEGMEPMTIKELLAMASTDLSFTPETVQAAHNLSDSIPEGGVLPFAKTLETYLSADGGMLDFYKNADKTYLPQINELYTTIKVLANDEGLMGMLSTDQATMFKTAEALLAKAYTLNNGQENAIDYDRIDVTSQGLSALLNNLSTLVVEKATTVADTMTLTQEVSVDAPGKYSVTVNVTFGETESNSDTFVQDQALTDDYVTGVIDALAQKLGIDETHYERVISTYPSTVTGPVEINVSFVAKQYDVVVDGETLGQVSIENTWLDLPVNNEHDGVKYEAGYFFYTYTIGGADVEVKETAVSYNFEHVLPTDGSNTITITRTELDERPYYNVTIEVKGKIVNPATVNDAVLVDLSTYTHTAKEFVIGTAWGEIENWIINESGAEDAALALVDWKGVNTDNYNRGYAGETTVLTQDITYTITYRPMYKTLTYLGVSQQVPYGYRLELPTHEAPAEGETAMEYVYTINGKDYDEGTIYKVTEDAEVTVRDQEATAKQYLTTLLVSTGTVTDSILSNPALIKGDSITIALPDGTSLIVESAEGGQKITAQLVNSKVGGVNWDADEGYLDVDNDGKFSDGDVKFTFAEDNSENENTYLAEDDYYVVFATYELPLTVEALGLTNEQMLAVMNIPYELKTDYDNQKRVLDALLGQKAIFDMMNDHTAIEGLPEQFAGLTFKGVLNLASGDTGAQMSLADATRTKAAELAAKIPTDGELPFTTTLRNYESRGMIDFYQNEMTYRTQINELNDIMTILTEDQGLMGLIAQAGMEDQFTTAQALLAEAYKLNDEYAINHDRINVSNANALTSLLNDLASDTVRVQYTEADIPAEMTWTQEVSAAAMGKVTVTVEGAIGDFAATPAQIILNKDDSIDADELNAIIAAMADELGITANAKHYACEISEYPDEITENITITATWTAIAYEVVVDGMVLGSVTIDGGLVTLPAHDNADYTYIYTIGEANSTPCDYQFTPETVDALANEGRIEISRKEVNAAENELTTKVNAMGATLLKDENGEYTMVLTLDVNDLQNDLMSFVFGLVLGSYESVKMGDEIFYGNGQYHLQTMIDLIMSCGLDSEGLLNLIDSNGAVKSDLFLPAANVLPEIENAQGNVDLGGKIVESTIDLVYSGKSHEMKFYITLDGQSADLVTARNAVATAQGYGITFVLDGGMTAVVDLNDEIYAAYAAALSMVGQVDVDNLDELNAQIAFGYLADHLEDILETATVDTINNTTGADISAYEKYYNFFQSYYSADLITYGDNDSKATVTFEGLPISSVLDSLQSTVDQMASSMGVSLTLADMIYEYETGLNLTTGVDLVNLDKQYVALGINAQSGDVTTMAAMMTAEDLKNIGDYNAVLLLADVNGDLNFTKTTVLDLNGMTVNGNITSSGKLIISDSDCTDAPGHVTGTVSGSDVTIIAGQYDCDVSAYLDGGYQQVGGVVSNKFFTTTKTGNDITVTLNTTPGDLAELANKQGLIDLAMEIAAGIVVNHYNMASLSIGGYEVYDIQLNDMLGMYKSSEKANTLIDTVLGCVSAPDLADLIDLIVADLTNFENLETKLSSDVCEVASYAIETAPWYLEFEHITDGDYLTANLGAASDKENGTLSIVVDGSLTDELADLAGALNDAVSEFKSDLEFEEIVRDGNKIAINGSYTTALVMDLSDNPEYVIMMAVILANGNDEIKADLVEAIEVFYESGKVRLADMETAFNKLTVDQITTALANTGRSETISGMIKNLGLEDVITDDIDDSAMGYDPLIDLMGAVLRRYSPSIDGTLGGVMQTEADTGRHYYGFQSKKDVSGATEKSVAGYTLSCDLTVAADHVYLYLFPVHLHDEEHLVWVDEVAATCTEDGTEGYWLCQMCGKIYADSDAATELTEEDLVIEKTGHDYSVVWAWSGYTYAEATFTCDCGYTTTLAADISEFSRIEATAESNGLVVYKATVIFDGVTYVDYKEETLYWTPDAPTVVVGVPTITDSTGMFGYSIDHEQKLIYLDLPREGVKMADLLNVIGDVGTTDADNIADAQIKHAKDSYIDLVITGSKLILTAVDGDATAEVIYTIVVLGDTNSNGRIESGDASRMKQHYFSINGIADNIVLTGYEELAADTNRNGRVESGDAVKNKVKYLSPENYVTHLE